MSDLDGVWETVINTPMGSQKGTLTLSCAGDAVTGTMVGPQGSLDIQDGKANGNEASWKAAISNPMPMTLEFSVKADGDELSGNVKLGAFGNAPIKGTRKT